MPQYSGPLPALSTQNALRPAIRQGPLVRSVAQAVPTGNAAESLASDARYHDSAVMGLQSLRRQKALDMTIRRAYESPMEEHYELGVVINLRVEAGEDPFDDEGGAYLRGEFIEGEAGRPFASNEARQRFAFDVRSVDFVALFEVLGICALGMSEPLSIEAIRAEPPRGAATPILGFRSPVGEWRPGAFGDAASLARRNETQAATIRFLGSQVAEREQALKQERDQDRELIREAHALLDRANVSRVEVHGDRIGRRHLLDRMQHFLALECPKCDGYRRLWNKELKQRRELRDQLVEREHEDMNERAQCWYLARRRKAEAMLQLKHDAVEAGPPDPVAVLNDVAAAIAARGLDAEVIATLNKMARRDAEQRSQATQAGVPDKGLTGQRYRIDVSVSDGNPVEVVGGALWSCMDLAMELGLGPEDIKRPLLQALAIFGHNVEITTKGGPSWPSRPPVPSYSDGGNLFTGGRRRMLFGRAAVDGRLPKPAALKGGAVPVCDTCNDTHQMELEGQGKVPCTRCPTPCPSCAENGGRGAYCESTPCDCSCHEMGT